MTVKFAGLWGLGLLVTLVLAAAPLYAAEIQEPADAVQSTVPAAQVAAQANDTHLQYLWSAANQFGSAQAWKEIDPLGKSVTRIVFTSLSGEIVESNFFQNGIKIVYPTGDFQLRGLPNGQSLGHVSVEPGLHQGELDNTSAAGGTIVDIKLDARGNPLRSEQIAQYVAAQNALWRSTSTVRSQMRKFADLAGVPIDPSSSMLEPMAFGNSMMSGTDTAVGQSLPFEKSSNGGAVPEELLSGCTWAKIGLAAAAANLAAEPENPLSWIAYAAASRAYVDECGGAQ